MTIFENYIRLRYKIERILSPIRFTLKRTFKYDLTFVLLIRDEAEYIKEWIDYHSLLFHNKKIHFYIIDNKSTDNLRDIIQDYIDNGLVTYRFANAETYPQVQLYTHALTELYSKTELMFCIDTDEFLIPSNNSFEIYDYIKSKVNIAGGFSINWLCFGSSNYITKPKGSVLESYLYRSEFTYTANSHVKTIINPRKVLYYKNPHNAYFKKGCNSINEFDELVPEGFNEHREYQFLRLHHYASKSLEEQKRKIERGWGKKSELDKANIKHNPHDINDVFDNCALNTLQYLKSRGNQ